MLIGIISFRAMNIQIDVVLDAIALSQGYSIVYDEPITQKININIQNIQWQEAFNQICKINNLEYKIISPNIIRVYKKGGGES